MSGGKKMRSDEKSFLKIIHLASTVAIISLIHAHVHEHTPLPDGRYLGLGIRNSFLSLGYGACSSMNSGW